jgi:hypothetical protein
MILFRKMVDMNGLWGFRTALILTLLPALPVWGQTLSSPGNSVAGVTPTPVICNNLIRGGGFEQGEAKYPGVGLYWETNDARPHPEVGFLDADIRHSGRYSQHLAAHPEWDRGMIQQFTNYNTVTPGKRYRVEAWVRTANVENPAGWYVLGLWWMRDDTWIGDVKMEEQEKLNYDWKPVTIEATAPRGANRLGVVLTRHTDGDAWYDDISVVEIGQECTPTPEPMGE